MASTSTQASAGTGRLRKAPLLVLLLFLFAPAGFGDAQPSALIGDWMTPNKSVVQVFSCQKDHLCARIVAVGPKDKPQQDLNNPDASLRTRAICGLTIGTDFVQDGAQQAKDGKIYDPESGKTYSAKMQADGDKLNMRGFVGVALLGRTETWKRTTAGTGTCHE